MAYFIYNDISSQDMGLMIVKMDLPSRAKQEIDTIKIPGRTQPLWNLKEEYSTTNIKVSCEVSDTANVRDIFAWLNGRGKLIFSDESDKYYDVNVCKAISTSRISNELKSITFDFECMPFAYATSNDPVTLNTPQTLAVGGSYPCEPIYKIYGTGNINFIVNGEALEIKDVSEHITIDTNRLIAYKNDTVLVNKTVGLYPMLGVGDNSISWTGTVTKVEIIKNERWL